MRFFLLWMVRKSELRFRTYCSLHADNKLEWSRYQHHGFRAGHRAARYSTVDLNCNVVPGVSQSVTGGIYGGQRRRGCGDAADAEWRPGIVIRINQLAGRVST